MKKTIYVIITAVVVFTVVLALLSLYSSKTIPYGNKIAVIKIDGTISSQGSILPTAQSNSNTIIKLLEVAEKDSFIKGILLEINSPGGSPVASSEIASKVKEIEDKVVVSWISDVGASGAYWIASSSDKVVAHPLSLTCSIGAFTVVSDWSEFFEEYGMNFTTIKAGKYKDIGSPYKPLEKDEAKILQDMIDEVQAEFINEIKENRGLTQSQVRKISDGQPCLGKDALDYGLVDMLGNKKDAINIIEEMADIKESKTVTLKEDENFFGELFGTSLMKSFYLLGIGIGHGLEDKGELKILS